MPARQESAARTRADLLAAGAAVAARDGVGALSVNRVVAQAGVAKGTFFHHFGDRSGFLLALHREVHDAVAAEVAAAVAGLPPGRGRLLCGTLAHLDGCRSRAALRALLTDARGEPVLRPEVAARDAAMAALAAADFAALGWSAPEAAAQLWVRLAAEAAVLEVAAGSADPDLRRSLAEFLSPPAGPRRPRRTSST